MKTRAEVPAGGTIVRPPVYVIIFSLWEWCKLGEVLRAAQNCASFQGIEFDLTLEQLVTNFAQLVQPNKPLSNEVVAPSRRPRLFRYSTDGRNLKVARVSSRESKDAPPHGPLKLDIEGPYPEDMFVRADWAEAVLKAAEHGVKRVERCSDGRVYGLTPLLPGHGYPSAFLLEKSYKEQLEDAGKG